ncbi:uncharacterized protein LOC111864276 isoform X3 [Cryptotermes secundus]|uniref:uncharacterized protein LOC111864276 isoform X3 n=1 Tax=Cryptotermes secundus TaxID=105785 RepID=UPI000CD7CBAE|nr:uncharacterized protein LOC111864276 isoform X3 [Cryptotermes secundus]
MSVSTCTPYTEKDCLAGSTVQSATANDEWLETHVAAGFKVWQIMFLCFAGLLTLALDRVRAEIRSDTDSLAHSEGTLSSGCCNCPSPALPLSEPLQEPHHGRKGSLQVPKKVTTYRKICDVTTVPGVSVDDLPVQGVLGSKFSSIVETTLTKLRPKKPDV